MTRDSTWYTVYGEAVAIKNMSDDHLRNTIRVLRDISPVGIRFTTLDPVLRRDYLNVMANECYARGLGLDELTTSEPVHE